MRKPETKKREKKGVMLSPLTYVSIEEAGEIRKSEDPTEYHRSILTIEEVERLQVPPRQYLLESLIAEGTINLVNGERGIGKSWFVAALANSISAGIDFGPWKISHSVPVMIVDGEMSLEDIHHRIKKLNSLPRRLSELYIYPDAFAYRIGLKRASLLDEDWREAIKANVLELGVKLLVLDNLASLAPGIDENEKVSFDPINQWLLEMRYAGVTIILVHHTGKSGNQRGTSSHEDHVDTVFVLSAPKGCIEKGCVFDIKTTKDRSNVTKRLHAAMELNDEGTGFTVTIKGMSQFDRMVNLFTCNPEITPAEARVFGISRATYFRVKKDYAAPRGIGIKELAKVDTDDKLRIS